MKMPPRPSIKISAINCLHMFPFRNTFPYHMCPVQLWPHNITQLLRFPLPWGSLQLTHVIINKLDLAEEELFLPNPKHETTELFWSIFALSHSRVSPHYVVVSNYLLRETEKSQGETPYGWVGCIAHVSLKDTAVHCFGETERLLGKVESLGTTTELSGVKEALGSPTVRVEQFVTPPVYVIIRARGQRSESSSWCLWAPAHGRGWSRMRRRPLHTAGDLL